MPGLGIGIAAVTNETFMPMDVAALISKYIWEIDSDAVLNLLPISSMSSGNKIWDVDTSTDPDTLKPKAASDMRDDGFWEVSGSNIRPLAV